MSLISAKNLVAPLKNKVHIVTIILCAIAFAVLRMSGAGFSSGPRRNFSVTNLGQPNYNQQGAPAYARPQNIQPKTTQQDKALLDIEKELGL